MTIQTDTTPILAKFLPKSVPTNKSSKILSQPKTFKNNKIYSKTTNKEFSQPFSMLLIKEQPKLIYSDIFYSLQMESSGMTDPTSKPSKTFSQTTDLISPPSEKFSPNKNSTLPSTKPPLKSQHTFYPDQKSATTNNNNLKP